jgi:uncharacterized membrane protein (UPF0127 family)
MRHNLVIFSAAVLLALIYVSSAAAVDATTQNGSQLVLPAGVQPVEFAAGEVIIKSATGTHSLRVEIAETGPQVERGLMYRTSLPENGGMLFIYPKVHRGSFWMFNTFIPLSVAYADERGVIFQIGDLVPCGNLSAAECAEQAYPARQPFRFALEVNQGYFERRGISVGDRLDYVRD